MAYAIAYRRGNSAHETEEQAKTIRLASQLYGYVIAQGGWKDEPLSASDSMIEHLLQTAAPGTTLLVANPYVLSSKASQALATARAFIGKGVNLVVASAPGGVLDLAALNANLAPIEALEGRIAELEGELSRKDSELAEEMDAFTRAIEEQTVAALAARGISLGALLRQPTGTLKPGDTVARPDQGRALKALRETLKFSQEEAGKLVGLDKSQVSKAETTGSANQHYDDLLMALQVEEIRREQAAKQAKRGVNAGRALLIEGAADMLRAAT